MNLLILLAVAYVGMSVIAFIAYAIDKRAARREGRRLRERTLHLLELAGGWPGALVAQQALRHKTRDTRFLIVFWAIVTVHVLLWIPWLVSLFGNSES